MPEVQPKELLAEIWNMNMWNIWMNFSFKQNRANLRTAWITILVEALSLQYHSYLPGFLYCKHNVVTQEFALPKFLLYKECLVNQRWNCPGMQSQNKQAVQRKAISVRTGYVIDIIHKHLLYGMGSGIAFIILSH